MDTLTHALSGALLARATAPREPGEKDLSVRARVAAGFLGAAFPDLDFVAGFLGPAQFLVHHRGVTHSLLMLPVWAWLLAWIFSRATGDARGLRPWFGVSALALATHIAGDLITSFGTIVFAPLSDMRAGIGTTFIIDLWFSGIILAGLAASLVWRRARLPAVAASLVLAGYVGVQWELKQRAIEFGERYAAAQKIRRADVSVQARPVSPFNWSVFVADDSGYRIAHVNLVREHARAPDPADGFIARLDSPYLPLDAARWTYYPRFGEAANTQAIARDAWSSASLTLFRWFAEAPAFDSVTEGSTCVWFVDLRFLTPGRETMPFRYGACRAKVGAPWRGYRRLDDERRVPLG